MIYRTSVGLDVHARSIAAAALDHLTGEVRQKAFAYDPSAVAEWVLSLDGPARCVYESGPTGFDLQRSLEAAGVGCCVGAVSKMLRPAGDRVKTDKRDAVFLARMLAVGNGHVRTLLVESAWHHARAYSPMSATSLADARGVPAPVAEAAERANRRLHDRCAHLRSCGKPVNLANAAVARELAGFVWAIATMTR